MTSPDDAIDRDAIKARYIAERGYWRPWTEALLRDNPRFLERYADYAGHPARVGPLPPKMVELIYVALDASSTHLFGSGLKTHMEKALALGARPAEIFDVLHLVAAQGLDSVYQAVAVLAEEIGSAGTESLHRENANTFYATHAGVPVEVLERIERLKLPASPAALSLLTRLDPGFLPVLLDFLEYGRPGDGLAPAERSLIEVALFACFTGFDREALRRRIRKALDGGCAANEVLQAIQLGAHLAVHGTALGAGVLEELRQ
jgi:alkylhydroperoxidase/carboxymuconolactone decarboxylase family protein YurZ